MITAKGLRSALSAYAAEHAAKFDWKRANVQPLTAEEQKERDEAKAAKLRQKKKEQAQRQKQRKQDEKERAAQEEVERKVCFIVLHGLFSFTRVNGQISRASL